MTVLFAVLKSIASVISIYSTLCFVRIILTWIPGLRGSRLEYFFSEICDPYLNMFSRIRWMHIGMLDFSPILAFSILSAASQILLQIANSGRLSFAYILAVIVKFTWDMFASVMILLFIMIVIRFIMLAAGKQGSMFWNSVDRLIFKLSNPFIKPFAKNRFVKPVIYALIAIFEFLLVYAAGRVGIYYLCILILKIPF